MIGSALDRARNWPLVLVIVLALLAHAPGLGWGFFADDHGLILMLERPIEHPTMRWWSLFDFGYAPRPGEENEGWSFVPWWTSPDWKVRFFRPISSLTHAADFALFGRNATLHHATSLALYTALLALVHALYRAAGLSRSVALCALAVFAFEDGSVMPVSWIANRNTLLEALFAVAAVLVLLRGGPAPSMRRIAASLALALGSCGSKESGVVTFGVLALLLASSALRSVDPAAKRRASLGSALAVAGALAYVGILLGAGYGTNSLFYVMPWSHPVEFGRRALLMFVLGPQGALGPFSIDMAMFMPVLLAPWLVIALAGGWTVSAWIARSERGLPLGLVFAAWSVLALVPQAGTLPSDRLMFVPMIGLAPWIGSFALRALPTAPWRRRALPLLVAVSAIPVSCLLTFGRTDWMIDVIERVRAATQSAEVPRDGTRCDAFVLQSGTILSMLAPDPAWVFLTGADRVRFHAVQVGRDALRVTTVDERTIQLEDLSGPMLQSPFEHVFLTTDDPPAVGSQWRGRGFDVVIRSVDPSGLRAIRIVLDEPLASARWRFLTWRDGAYRRVEPPPPGAALELPPAEPLDPLMP